MSPGTDHRRREAPFADVGLLSPVWVGTHAEALTSDSDIAEAMVVVEAAVARAVRELGIDFAAGAASPDLDPRELALAAVPSGNPTIPVVAAIRAAAPDGTSVHVGATSQDIVDTALMLVSVAVLRETEGQLLDLARQLVALADEHRSTRCVARTLTQQAMPTTLGFRLASWLAGVDDAIEAVRGTLPLPVSIGGPVGTAAAYGIAGPDVLTSVADALGLAAPVISWHTRRTPVLGLAAALAAVGEACGRICADVLLMAQTEVAEASDGSGGASSAMAHKANPIRSVLVISAVRQLPGLLATVAAAGAEGSERPAGAWHAEWQPLRTMLRLAGAAAERTADVARGLRFDGDALARNLELLVAAVGEDQTWVHHQTVHVDVWIDRVLARHEEVVR